jgi:hypothetical protein
VNDCLIIAASPFLLRENDSDCWSLLVNRSEVLRRFDPASATGNCLCHQTCWLRQRCAWLLMIEASSLLLRENDSEFWSLLTNRRDVLRSDPISEATHRCQSRKSLWQLARGTHAHVKGRSRGCNNTPIQPRSNQDLSRSLGNESKVDRFSVLIRSFWKLLTKWLLIGPVPNGAVVFVPIGQHSCMETCKKSPF